MSLAIKVLNLLCTGFCVGYAIGMFAQGFYVETLLWAGVATVSLVLGGLNEQ